MLGSTIRLGILLVIILDFTRRAGERGGELEMEERNVYYLSMFVLLLLLLDLLLNVWRKLCVALRSLGLICLLGRCRLICLRTG